jgi:hypothetical protein
MRSQAQFPEQPHDSEPWKQWRATGRPRRSPIGCFPGLDSRRSPTQPREDNASRRGANLDSKVCRDPGSNRGPSNLQRGAFPTELSRLLRRARRLDGLGPNALSPRGGRLAKFGRLERWSFVSRFVDPPSLTTKRQGGWRLDQGHSECPETPPGRSRQGRLRALRRELTPSVTPGRRNCQGRPMSGGAGNSD